MKFYLSGPTCMGLFLTSLCFAKIIPESHVASMVPKGQVVRNFGREFSEKTEAGTRVMVELFRDGELDEASGLNLGKGDQFEPGQGLISLSTAARALEKTGHRDRGQWHLEKDPKLGWIYELEAMFSEEQSEYIVDAKSDN